MNLEIKQYTNSLWLLLDTGSCIRVLCRESNKSRIVALWVGAAPVWARGSECTYCSDGIGMSRKSLQAFTSLHVPDANALIKLQTRRKHSTYARRVCAWTTTTTTTRWRYSLVTYEHINFCDTNICDRFTYWAWHDEIWLWIKVTAENVVTVTLQRLQTFSLKAALKNLFSKRHFKTAYALCTQHLCVLTRTVT